MTDYSHLISTLFQPNFRRVTHVDMAAWFKSFKLSTGSFSGTIERAILGGRSSDVLGFAFASAYQSAIESLFDFQGDALASFCVTEEKGNHPRAIESRLEQVDGAYRLSGHKSFVSGGLDSRELFVACKTGEYPAEDGQMPLPILKIVRVATDQEGVSITPMPELPFLPEVSHGAVAFDQVLIAPDMILEGDGYLDYIKPFRTCEDVHVLAAVLAFRLGEAITFNWSKEIIEQHLSMLVGLGALADMNWSSPVMHVALSGFRRQLNQLIELTDDLFQETDPQGYQCWLRDKGILSVAKKAHEVRTEKAWSQINPA